MNRTDKPSKYLQYLPAIYQGDQADTKVGFLGQFLKAFEKLLSDRPERAELETEGFEEIPVGIETILDQIQDYFNPFLTPPQFLKWLASWVAVTLKEDKEWYGDEDLGAETGKQSVPLDTYRKTRNRELIHQIVQLYQKRGTREGLIEYLKVYLGEQATITINDFPEPFRIGASSTVGVSTVVNEGRPYYFEINMILPIPTLNLKEESLTGGRKLLEQKRQVLTEIIEREKPAHTYYGLIITVPTMKVGYQSTIGSDTLLGGSIT